MALNNGQIQTGPKPDRGRIVLKARVELSDYLTAWMSVHKLTQSEVIWLVSEALYKEGLKAVGTERKRKSNSGLGVN